jgi:hypothetical protein
MDILLKEMRSAVTAIFLSDEHAAGIQSGTIDSSISPMIVKAG